MEFEKSSEIITKLNWPQGSIPELHQALNFMLARQGQREQELLILISEWLPEKRLLEIPLENKYLTKYRIRSNSLQSNRFKNIYWIWKINKKYNKLSFVDNFISLVNISINSINKYGFK